MVQRASLALIHAPRSLRALSVLQPCSKTVLNTFTSVAMIKLWDFFTNMAGEEGVWGQEAGRALTQKNAQKREFLSSPESAEIKQIFLTFRLQIRRSVLCRIISTITQVLGKPYFSLNFKGNTIKTSRLFTFLFPCTKLLTDSISTKMLFYKTVHKICKK